MQGFAQRDNYYKSCAAKSPTALFPITRLSETTALPTLADVTAPPIECLYPRYTQGALMTSRSSNLFTIFQSFAKHST